MFYAILIAVTSILDLSLKSGVEAGADENYPREVKGTGGKVQIRKLHNSGLPLGVLKEHPEVVRCMPLAVASSLLLRLACLLPGKGHRLEKAGLSCMIGGAASNLFDRFFRGYVVDYLYVDQKPADRVVFNLGDVFIAAGSAMAGLSGALNSAGAGRKSGGMELKKAAAASVPASAGGGKTGGLKSTAAKLSRLKSRAEFAGKAGTAAKNTWRLGKAAAEALAENRNRQAG